MKNAVATIIDKNHLPYFRRFFESVRQYGRWQDAFVVLAYDFDKNDEDLKQLESLGVNIYHCQPLINRSYRHWGPEVLTYLYLFTAYFKQWQTVIYLDVDCIVRCPLKSLTKKQGFFATNFYHRGHPSFTVNGLTLTAADLINDGVMAFSTDMIKEDTFSELLTIYQGIDLERLPEVYGGGIDELILAIYFFGRKKDLPLDYNVIPNELRRQFGIRCESIHGSIIHHAAGNFYPKPWNPTSPFYLEWSGFLPVYYKRWIERNKLRLTLLSNLTADQFLGVLGLWVRKLFSSFYYKKLKK